MEFENGLARYYSPCSHKEAYRKERNIFRVAAENLLVLSVTIVKQNSRVKEL